MIRGGLVDSVAQKVPQAQRVGHSPGNAAFTIDPFEESDQHHPEVYAGNQGWPAHAIGIIALAFSFAKLVKVRLLHHPFQFPVERMPGGFDHFGAIPQLFLPFTVLFGAHCHNQFYPETFQIGNDFRDRLLTNACAAIGAIFTAKPQTAGSTVFRKSRPGSGVVVGSMTLQPGALLLSEGTVVEFECT
jgi:hypothetical protein